MRQLGLDPRHLVFIDETWTKTNMTRLYGRAASGQRLVAQVPHGHWKTTTLIAALDHMGIRCSTTVDGAINREIFEAFVQQVLIPTLRPGDLVVLDNLSSHKGPAVAAQIAAVGAQVLYLPAYSPDLNPIEPAFSKIKQLLRSLACRDQKTLWQSIQPVLDQITASDAQGFFRHCGYTLQAN